MRNIELPENLNWQMWVDRWDKMQQRYLVNRAERFEVIVRVIRDTQNSIVQIIDLGCGTGSLMLEMLQAFPKAELIGIDFDPTLLPLARQRLAKFSNRIKLILVDLRQEGWLEYLEKPADAVISATALHWLRQKELVRLYGHIAQILRPGGIFLNADHAGSGNDRIQQVWEKHRDEMLNSQEDTTGETWESFWKAYMEALGLKTPEIRQRVLGGWKGGVEKGLPLTWHFDKLKAAGFTCVDCFWRCDCDAIYGGIRK